MFIQDAAELLNQLQVSRLIASPNIVRLTRLAILNNGRDGLEVVFNVEPISDLLTIPINRQWLAFKCPQDYQWDQLLGDQIRSVIIVAIGERHKESVSVCKGSDKVVVGSL